MMLICDTHILLFWANEPARLSRRAAAALDRGRREGNLAISDICLWELALLHERGRLILPEDVPPGFYLNQLLQALRLDVLPISADLALLSRSSLFEHGDPADRLIAATALHYQAPLISADRKLRSIALPSRRYLQLPRAYFVVAVWLSGSARSWYRGCRDEAVLQISTLLGSGSNNRPIVAPLAKCTTRSGQSGGKPRRWASLGACQRTKRTRPA